MELTAILDSLAELESFLKCSVCLDKCKNPVRIKICGHYFCEECIKKSKNNKNCPECKTYYDNLDLDFNNIARQTENYLSELKAILSNENITITPTEKVSEENKDILKFPETQRKLVEDHCIFYDNEKYHINFVDNLYTKLNVKGESPLHISCKKKKVNEVVNIINKKVDINLKDNAGWAPLHEAVESQCLEVIEILLKHGALVNIPGVEYTTPLHKAVSKNNVPMIKLLLDYGADKNAVDYCGLKPVDFTKNEEVKNLLESHTEVIKLTKELFLPNKISVYCHTIDEEYKNKLRKCSHVKVEDTLDVIKRKITHIVIKKTHKPSFKILVSLLEGLQFIPQEGIENFLNKNYFIPIPDYIFIHSNQLNNGIRKAMMSSILKLPKLFDGINFFIEGHITAVPILNLNVDKEYLTKLIKAGGGHLLYRAPALRTCEESFNHSFHTKDAAETYRCCNYIIYEQNNPLELLYNMAELKHKSSEWFINCIINFEVI